VIFIDTGAFLALHRESDQHHAEAVRFWPTLDPPLVTSNHVLDEFATRMGRLAGFRLAADSVTHICSSPTIDVLQSTRDDEIAAILWMRKYADQAISFTDCVSFALMRRHGIRTAFTFDRHFRMAGFHVIGLR
jgi:predicted nucleic acid-binding protein